MIVEFKAPYSSHMVPIPEDAFLNEMIKRLGSLSILRLGGGSKIRLFKLPTEVVLSL